MPLVNEYNITSVKTKGEISFLIILLNNLAKLFSTTQMTWYPLGTTKTHLMLLNNISHIQYRIHPSRSSFRQTYIYPHANRYLTYLIQWNETAKRVSFQYKSLPTHTDTQRTQKSRCPTDWYKMLILCFSKPKFPFSVACLSCCQTAWLKWENGHWFLSACLSISVPRYIHLR